MHVMHLNKSKNLIHGFISDTADVEVEDENQNEIIKTNECFLSTPTRHFETSHSERYPADFDTKGVWVVIAF
jgi:hypothetical protein